MRGGGTGRAKSAPRVYGKDIMPRSMPEGIQNEHAPKICAFRFNNNSHYKYKYVSNSYFILGQFSKLV